MLMYNVHIMDIILPNGKILFWNNKLYYGNTINQINNFVYGISSPYSSSATINLDNCSGWALFTVTFNGLVQTYTDTNTYGSFSQLCTSTTLNSEIVSSEEYSSSTSNVTTIISCKSYIRNNILYIQCASNGTTTDITIERIQYLYLKSI